MTINPDIAATLNDIVWPIVVLVIVLVHRKRIPVLVERLAGRITKLEFAGISLELARAKPFLPKWSGSSGALDLRHTATAIQVSDSTARTFLAQLTEQRAADYGEVTLGAGNEWLTSHLFILSIVFARMKGLKCFVFVETSGDERRRLVGWDEPDKIRWALARRYPWLELAYADSYFAAVANQNNVIVSDQGRLRTPWSASDPSPSIDLLKGFLQRVQSSLTPPVPGSPDDWVLLDPATGTRERAHWTTGEFLEELLGNDCNTTSVRSAELRSKNMEEQPRIFLSVPERFVAVTTEDRRFEYLVDRDGLLEQVASSLSSGSHGRS